MNSDLYKIENLNINIIKDKEIIDDTLNNLMLKNNYLETFHAVIESQKPYPTENLIYMINYSNVEKQKILNDENTLKWVCAYSSPMMIEYLHNKVKTKDINGCITACIMNFKSWNMEKLLELGYQKEIFKNKYFEFALSRYMQYPTNTSVLNIFFNNLKEIKEDNWKAEFNKRFSFEMLNNENILLYALKNKDEIFKDKDYKFKKELNHRFANRIIHKKMDFNIYKEILNNIPEDFKKYIKKNITRYISEVEIKNNEINNVMYIIENHKDIIQEKDIDFRCITEKNMELTKYIKKYNSRYLYRMIKGFDNYENVKSILKKFPIKYEELNNMHPIDIIHTLQKLNKIQTDNVITNDMNDKISKLDELMEVFKNNIKEYEKINFSGIHICHHLLLLNNLTNSNTNYKSKVMKI